ncbi:MAG: MFS transporter [Halioglobus sp.]|nr:MFS transporter [Halioglobus sp.]
MNESADPITTPFHGWRVLGLCTLSQFVAIGCTMYLLGVFIQPLAQLFGATQGQIGSASGVFAVAGCILSPFLGILADRGKSKVIMLCGAVSMTLGLILLSQAQGLLQAALVCVLLQAPAAAMLGTIPTTVMVAQWFTRRRGFAIGITAAGISMGGFVMPPLAAWLLGQFGPRQSLMVLGCGVGLILIPAIWRLAVVKPADIGQHPDGIPLSQAEVDTQAAAPSIALGEIFRRTDFWTIGLSVGIISFAGILIITYLAPYAKATGMSLQNSAFLLSLYAISGIAGKFTTGWLSDKFPPRRIMTATLVMAAIGWLPIVFADDIFAFAITASTVGFAMGGLIPVWATLIALNFGLQNFGRVRGIMALVLVAFTIIPGPLGGYLYDSTGSYATAFGLLWWCLPLGVTMSLFIAGPPSPTPATE